MAAVFVATPSRMKILQVITDRDRRGAQVFATDLHAGLVSLAADVETVALTRGTHGDLLDIDVLGPARRSLETFRELRRRASDADIVIAHGSATLLACAVALIGTRTPFVYRQISDPTHWAASLSRRLRVACFIRRAAGIVVLSPSVAAVFSHHYRILPERMTVIPNAVPAGRFMRPSAEDRTAARTNLGVPEEMICVVSLSALSVEKGVDIAIRGVSELSRCRLLIVGDGPDRARLETLSAQMASNRITFTGPLSDPRVALAAADVLVLPSRGGDSMPAVLIEAGLCGLPCISTPVGAIADVVLDGTTGCIVPIGDQNRFSAALRQLSEDPERRHAFGAAAERYCREHFTIEATAPAWLDLIDSIVRRPTRRGRACATQQPRG